MRNQYSTIKMSNVLQKYIKIKKIKQFIKESIIDAKIAERRNIIKRLFKNWTKKFGKEFHKNYGENIHLKNVNDKKTYKFIKRKPFYDEQNLKYENFYLCYLAQTIISASTKNNIIAYIHYDKPYRAPIYIRVSIDNFETALSVAETIEEFIALITKL